MPIDPGTIIDPALQTLSYDATQIIAALNDIQATFIGLVLSLIFATTWKG